MWESINKLAQVVEGFKGNMVNSTSQTNRATGAVESVSLQSNRSANPPVVNIDSNDEAKSDEDNISGMTLDSVLKTILDLVPDLRERQGPALAIKSRAYQVFDKPQTSAKTFPLSDLVSSGFDLHGCILGTNTSKPLAKLEDLPGSANSKKKFLKNFANYRDIYYSSPSDAFAKNAPLVGKTLEDYAGVKQSSNVIKVDSLIKIESL
jgi:hypothetical protein